MTQIPNNIERHTLGSARLPYAGLVSIVHCSSLCLQFYIILPWGNETPNMEDSK